MCEGSKKERKERSEKRDKETRLEKGKEEEVKGR